MTDYTPSGKPEDNTRGISKQVRDELLLVKTAVNSKIDKNNVILARTYDTITGFDSSDLNNEDVIFFLGRDTVNDGGGGWFTFWENSVQPADGGTVFAPTGGGKLFRDGWTIFGFNGKVNVQWFGVKPDWEGGSTGTDITAGWQSAIDAINAFPNDGELYFPRGGYRKADTSATILMYSNITISGDGDSSVIYHEDKDTNPRKDLLKADDASIVKFKDIKFLGSLDTYSNETNQSQCLTGGDIGALTLINVTFEKLRYMATAFSYVRDVHIEGCRFKDIVRDGARLTHSQNVRILGNSFIRVADDAVAIHSVDSDSTVASSAVDYITAPVGSGVIISGNTFEASQGIKVLGAKVVKIGYNTMKRMLRNPILVANNGYSPEGNTPVFAIHINDNIILDTFGDQGTDYCIKVDIEDRYDGGLASQPGAIASVFNYNWLNNIDDGLQANIGAWAINILNNTIAWSLPRSVNYSSYGYGQLFDRSPSVGYSDPAITDSSYAAHGIEVQGPIRAIRISCNILSGGSTTHYAMYLWSGTNADNTVVAEDFDVTDNTISDWPTNGAITLNHQTTNGARHLNLKGNRFNLDPFFRAATHASDNTWTSDSGVTAIVTNSRSYMGEMSGNHFLNMGRIIDSSAIITPPLSNYAYFQPSGLGLDGVAGNKGIRRVPLYPQFVCVTYDADPTSATYGAMTGGKPELSLDAMPTTGSYVYGHFVKAAKPLVSGVSPNKYNVIGWVRLTTGSGHVAGTDWHELRCLTGT